MVLISGAVVLLCVNISTNFDRMYSMKPIYTNVDSIEIPDNMYKMNSLHLGDDVSQSSAGSNVREFANIIFENSFISLDFFFI